MKKSIISMALAGLMLSAAGTAMADGYDRGRDRDRHDRIERHYDRYSGYYDRHRYYDDRRPGRHARHHAKRHAKWHAKRRHSHRHYRRHHAPAVRYYRHSRGHHCRLHGRHFHNGYAYYGPLERVVIGAVALGVISELLDD